MKLMSNPPDLVADVSQYLTYDLLCTGDASLSFYLIYLNFQLVQLDKRTH
jgi:hypothetical protein